ncbi:hypothetical protein AN958_11064 [Leucoagaricus sp. SymC.cos]|nr:hypothetical protein AN958_11064 [Leucoagaricus sp. SymC.cos]
MQAVPEAFLLLTLPNCTLKVKDYSETGPLGLQCVTVPIPDAASVNDRDVYLVLKLNMSETPIDPERVIQRADTPFSRIYTFYSTPNDSTELVLTVPCAPGDTKSTPLLEDMETFESILEQYVVDFRSPTSARTQAPPVPDRPPPTYTSDTKDLRGHLVMINEETGEVVGEVEDRFRIQEDPMMYERGHERDPVVIEVPDEAGLREGDANAMQAFARIIPPDQRDWITKSATIVSHAISYTTNLLVTTISTASNYYIAKSNPSPHHSSNNLTASNAGNEKRSTFPIPGRAPSPTPPPLPPRALVFLTSERTRKGLRSVHTVSGQAVKVSAKTVRTVDNMIRRAMGSRPKENRLGYVPAPHSSLTPIPYASPSPPGSSTPYTPYNPASGSSAFSPREWKPDSKPPLSPRSHTISVPGSPQPPPLPPRNMMSPPLSRTPEQYQRNQQHDPISNPPVQPKLTTFRRLLISADLILSTIDDSARRLLDSGTNNFGRVMHHKYGAEAAESSLLMAGTARNVGLVYIDMSGIGRRALLRRAGMSFVKGMMQTKDDGKRPVPPIPSQQPQK